MFKKKSSNRYSSIKRCNNRNKKSSFVGLNVRFELTEEKIRGFCNRSTKIIQAREHKIKRIKENEQSQILMAHQKGANIFVRGVPVEE